MLWKPLVVCPEPGLRAQLRLALPPLHVIELSEYVTPEAVAVLERKHGCNVCLLDAESDPEKAFPLIRAISEAGTPVIAMCAAADGPSILRCLRHGASEFLAQPVTEADVEAVLERVSNRSPASRKTAPRVLSFVGGKGSCGCTTALVNLALRLPVAGAGRVLLVDLDLITGSIGFHLKLKPMFSVLDCVGEWSRMDDDLWKRMIISSNGVDILLAPEEPAQISLDGARVAALVELWRSRYDLALLDCPISGGSLSLAAARLSDQVFVVTTNEIAALYGTQRSILYLERNGIAPERIRVLVNRHKPETGLNRDGVEKALKKPVFAVLPNDFAGAQSSLLEGDVAKPHCEFGKAIRRLAIRVADKPVTEQHRPRPAANFFSDFFKKRAT